MPKRAPFRFKLNDLTSNRLDLNRHLRIAEIDQRRPCSGCNNSHISVDNPVFRFSSSDIGTFEDKFFYLCVFEYLDTIDLRKTLECGEEFTSLNLPVVWEE